MTKEEVLKTLHTLRIAFPNAYKEMPKSDANIMIALWTEMLSGDSYEDVMDAVKSLIGKKPSTWIPAVGDVKQEMEKLHPQSSWALNRRPYPQSFIDDVHKFLAEEEAAGRYKPTRPPLIESGET